MAKGSVRKKGKKWYYRFYVEDASGNLVQKECVGTESKSETEKLLRQAMDDYEKKKFVAKAENLTVGQLLDVWAEEELKTGTLSNGTVENYLGTIRNIKKHPLAERKLKNVTSEHLQSFFDLLSFGGVHPDGKEKKGYSKDYIHSFSAVMQQSFRFAVFPKQYPKNCELWRSEWAKVCNEHLPLQNQVDHRSYEKQGKLQIPTIHEGADARKIEQKFLAGQEIKGSWKVAENQIIKQQNTLLQKILDTFGKVSGALSLWKERLNDIRRKPGNYTLNGIHDWSNRRTAEPNGRNDSGNAESGHSTLSYAKTESEITKIKQRVIRAAQHFAKYRGTAFQDGRTENEDRAFGKRKSAMAEIGTEAEQRKQFITETEHRIAELEQQIEKGRDIDERIQRIKERRTVGRTSPLDRGDTRRTRTERTAYRGTEDAAQRISDLEREIKQREQSREYSSIKERLEAGRQSIADREREVAKRKRHDRGMSR